MCQSVCALLSDHQCVNQYGSIRVRSMAILPTCPPPLPPHMPDENTIGIVFENLHIKNCANCFVCTLCNLLNIKQDLTDERMKPR